MRLHLGPYLIAAALVLSACGGGGEPPTGPLEASTPSVSSSPPESDSSTVLATDKSDEEANIAHLLGESGPDAGDAFDVQEDVTAVKEEGPQSEEDWAETIVDATHGDYAEATQRLLDFDTSIGEDAATPVEKLGEVEVVGQNHFAVVLDASGSMAEQSRGGSRMQQAKTAVRQFASKLPPSSTLSLRVYGHEGSNSRADKAKSCAATEVVYDGPPKGVGRAMSKCAPTGWTPIAKSIDAARADIPAEASDAIVYVVTDGIETCGGDPVKAARRLARSGVKPVVNVIGFQVGNADQKQLRRIAKVGGGVFTDARAGADLESYWEPDRRHMMDAWMEWQREALDRIEEDGRANLDAAESMGRALLDGITDEWDHQSDVIDLLESDEAFEDDTRRSVWRTLYERKRALWSWSYEMKRSSWRDAYEIKVSRWREAYDLGTGKWSEYYAKRN